MIEWTDAERGTCFGTCGGDIKKHAPDEDLGCAMFEDTLTALAPHVEARVQQAKVEGHSSGYRDGVLIASGKTVDELVGETKERLMLKDAGLPDGGHNTYEVTSKDGMVHTFQGDGFAITREGDLEIYDAGDVVVYIPSGWQMIRKAGS